MKIDENLSFKDTFKHFFRHKKWDFFSLHPTTPCLLAPGAPHWVAAKNHEDRKICTFAHLLTETFLWERNSQEIVSSQWDLWRSNISLLLSDADSQYRYGRVRLPGAECDIRENFAMNEYTNIFVQKKIHEWISKYIGIKSFTRTNIWYSYWKLYEYSNSRLVFTL